MSGAGPRIENDILTDLFGLNCSNEFMTAFRGQSAAEHIALVSARSKRNRALAQIE